MNLYIIYLFLYLNKILKKSLL